MTDNPLKSIIDLDLDFDAGDSDLRKQHVVLVIAIAIALEQRQNLSDQSFAFKAAMAAMSELIDDILDAKFIEKLHEFVLQIEKLSKSPLYKLSIQETLIKAWSQSRLFKKCQEIIALVTPDGFDEVAFTALKAKEKSLRIQLIQRMDQEEKAKVPK